MAMGKPKLYTMSAGVPDELEERSVAHLAFLNAHRSAQPEDLRIEGMQDFAAAVGQLHHLCMVKQIHEDSGSPLCLQPPQYHSRQ